MGLKCKDKFWKYQSPTDVKGNMARKMWEKSGHDFKQPPYSNQWRNICVRITPIFYQFILQQYNI